MTLDNLIIYLVDRSHQRCRKIKYYRYVGFYALLLIYQMKLSSSWPGTEKKNISFQLGTIIYAFASQFW